MILGVSTDTLLNIESITTEKIIETIKIGGAHIEILEKPETILAGRVVYAKDYENIDAFYEAINSFPEEDKQRAFKSLVDSVLPIYDINMSANFWREEEKRAYGFMREVLTENQPAGVDVFKMPASLYVRAYTDKESAQLLTKDKCEIWELFYYLREFFLPNHGLRMSDNGAQELEVYDTLEHGDGYAYMPIERV